jgi:large-conductance mechanosensitive channel
MKKKEDDLIIFLANFGVISTFIGFLLATSLERLFTSFSINIINPTVILFFEFIGFRKIINFKLHDQSFHITQVISYLITFALIFIIVYFIFGVFAKKMSDRITNQRNLYNINNDTANKNIINKLDLLNDKLAQQNPLLFR